MLLLPACVASWQCLVDHCGIQDAGVENLPWYDPTGLFKGYVNTAIILSFTLQATPKSISHILITHEYETSYEKHVFILLYYHML